MSDTSNLNTSNDLNNNSIGFINDNHVGAVLVTYQPQQLVLKATIRSLLHQVSHLYLIDNTPGGAFEVIETVLYELNCSNLVNTFISRDNIGIACAQNKGIKFALADKCDFILLSDQDTRFPPNCVKGLLDGFSKLHQKNIKVAVLAPAFINTRTPEFRPFFIRLKGFFIKRIFATSGLVEATQVIASGQLMPATVFTDVGFMDERLFIDWVDIEWCWRASAKGWKIYGSADVVINHTLGDNTKLLAGRAYTLRPPVRHYYIVRNAVILALHRQVIPWKHRIHVFFKAIRFLFGAPLFARPHLLHLQHTMLGFLHGLVNRDGKF